MPNVILQKLKKFKTENIFIDVAIIILFNANFQVQKSSLTNDEHFDYEAVNEDELMNEMYGEEEEDEEDDDVETAPQYMRNGTPISATDVDIKIARQKMSLAESGLELIRVSLVFKNIAKPSYLLYFFISSPKAFLTPAKGSVLKMNS